LTYEKLGTIVLIFSLEKDIDTTLKKDEKVSDKAWDMTAISYFEKIEIEVCIMQNSTNSQKEKTQFFKRIHKYQYITKCIFLYDELGKILQITY